MPSPDGEIQAWLTKADHDLTSAKILLDHDPPVVDTALFHCQQTAEKVLKAFLVSRDQAFEKVHSLVYLIELCRDHDAEFEELRPHAELLSPFAVVTRYPGDVVNVSSAQARSVLKAAEDIVEFVNARMR